jgi:hypothetical protein
MDEGIIATYVLAVRLSLAAHYLTVPTRFMCVHFNICAVRLAYDHFISDGIIFMKLCHS